MVLGNCVAWVIYGLYTANPYVFLSNGPGVLVGLYMFSTGMQLGSPAQRKQLETLVLGMGTTLVASGYCMSMVVKSPEAAANLAVLVANIFW
jgi:hypothetical protein